MNSKNSSESVHLDIGMTVLLEYIGDSVIVNQSQMAHVLSNLFPSEFSALLCCAILLNHLVEPS